jgi:hypothetical protein
MIILIFLQYIIFFNLLWLLASVQNASYVCECVFFDGEYLLYYFVEQRIN